MKKIFIRSDSSSLIGAGHVMRDLVLASQFKKDLVIFITRNLKGNLNFKIKEAGYKNIIIESNDVIELINLVKNYEIDLIIIDHYNIDCNFEKKLKKKTNVQILSFDDTYEKHYCDILLNQNISANKKKYTELVPNYCKLKCGQKYTLIRDEFINTTLKKREIKKNQKLKVFLAMGGSDSQNISMKIIKVLLKFKNLNINVVTTSSNKHLIKLNKLKAKVENINIHIDSKNVASIMNNSNFAIISPSVILTEIIYMKLPFISIKTADNQNDIQEFLKSKKFFALDCFHEKKLNYFLQKIFQKKEYNKIKNKIKLIKLKGHNVI